MYSLLVSNIVNYCTYHQARISLQLPEKQGNQTNACSIFFFFFLSFCFSLIQWGNLLLLTFCPFVYFLLSSYWSLGQKEIEIVLTISMVEKF